MAMQVKGLEMPAYDPRGVQSQGLAYATANRGGCHLRANMMGPAVLGLPKLVDRLDGRGQAGLLIQLQNLYAVLDSLVACKFDHMGLGEESYARFLAAVTGLQFDRIQPDGGSPARGAQGAQDSDAAGPRLLRHRATCWRKPTSGALPLRRRRKSSAI